MAEHDHEFGAFMAARWAPLCRFAFVLCGDRQEAEDLAQVALTRTYRAWTRIAAREATDSYTRTTIVRLFLNDRRRRRLRTVPLEGADGGPAVVARDGEGDRDALWVHVMGLPPRQRAVVVLRYYEDLTEAQIAEVLGCSRGTVKSQASKALASLRGAVPADLAQ